MKKILVLILALVMTMSLTACGGGIEEIEITRIEGTLVLE